jgi:predicted DNA-binding WGR domain protein
VRRFEFVGGTSKKYWEISQTGTQVTVRFGRMGSEGQTQTKEYGTWDDAAERVRKLVAEKLREGYEEVGGSSVQQPAGLGPPAALPRYEVPALPDDGPLVVGNVQLGGGRRLRGDSQYLPRGVAAIEEPVLWATDSPVDLAGRSVYWLRQDVAALNLVPVLLKGLDDDPHRPWDSAEFCPTDPRRAILIDVVTALGDSWRACTEGQDPDDEEVLKPVRPFGKTFPGIAQQTASWRDVRSDGDVLEQIRDRRVALVAAERPADILAALGWMGAVNVHEDPAFLTAVLRSWEVRWYARLVEIGFDNVTLTVCDPPRDEKTAVGLAAEHFAFCPDNVWQGSETIEKYARELVGARLWHFWWD